MQPRTLQSLLIGSDKRAYSLIIILADNFMYILTTSWCHIAHTMFHFSPDDDWEMEKFRFLFFLSDMVLYVVISFCV